MVEHPLQVLIVGKNFIHHMHAPEQNFGARVFFDAGTLLISIGIRDRKPCDKLWWNGCPLLCG